MKDEDRVGNTRGYREGRWKKETCALGTMITRVGSCQPGVYLPFGKYPLDAIRLV
jgi:hypothetical protein